MTGECRSAIIKSANLSSVADLAGDSDARVSVCLNGSTNGTIIERLGVGRIRGRISKDRAAVSRGRKSDRRVSGSDGDGGGGDGGGERQVKQGETSPDRTGWEVVEKQPGGGW